MKIVYCHCSLYSPGGMERVLLNKVRWMRENRPDWEIIVVTTDQQDRAPFYEFPEGVRLVDLDINYSLDNDRPVYERIPLYLKKRRLHRKRLASLLMRERADVTVSLYPSESSFIPEIKDGSKKVLELHYNRFFRLQYGRKGILGLIDRFRSVMDQRIARKFDRFVVLTQEDRNYWGGIPCMVSIANAALPMPRKSDCKAKRVIAVGRLDHQKGFDRLIDVWRLVKKSALSDGWKLDIFGQGEWYENLERKVKDNGLSDSVAINAPTKDITAEYAGSSILAMTSRYEGFPMVMIEAMSAGIPVVTFDYKCGPRDIVSHGRDGFIVKEGDTEAFAQTLLGLMANDVLRTKMGKNAMEVEDRYSENRIMGQWTDLFETLISE